LTEAEELCRTALDMATKEKGDPWAEHTLAHVLHSQGRIKEAAEVMLSVTHHWDECNSFMYSHNWWHYSLLLLDMEKENEQILEIFDKHIWNRDKNFVQDQIMATSFLLLLELRNIDFGDRLEDVVSYISKENEFCCELQSDLLRIWAFLKTGKKDLAEKIMNKIIVFCNSSERASLLQKTYLQCAQAIYSYANLEYKKSLEFFEKCDFKQFQQIGASKEQSLIFIEVWIDALQREDNYENEKKLIEENIGKERIQNTVFWLQKMILINQKQDVESFSNEEYSLLCSNLRQNYSDFKIKV